MRRSAKPVVGGEKSKVMPIMTGIKELMKDLDLFGLLSAKEEYTLIELRSGKWLLFRKDSGFVFAGTKIDCQLYIANINPVCMGSIKFIEFPSVDYSKLAGM